MAFGKGAVANLNKTAHVVKAQSTETIYFGGAMANYFRITNGGGSALYLGVSMSPTPDFHDCMIPAESTKLYVDPFGKDHIQLFNPGTEDANIILVSFLAEFDPTVLAVSELGQDFTDVALKTETSISGFETSLPAGINTIGTVNISTDSISLIVKRQQDIVDQLDNLMDALALPSKKSVIVDVTFIGDDIGYGFHEGQTERLNKTLGLNVDMPGYYIESIRFNPTMSYYYDNGFFQTMFDNTTKAEDWFEFYQDAERQIKIEDYKTLDGFAQNLVFLKGKTSAPWYNIAAGCSDTVMLMRFIVTYSK